MISRWALHIGRYLIASQPASQPAMQVRYAMKSVAVRGAFRENEQHTYARCA